MTRSVNDGGVCRTAPATPGLLNSAYPFLKVRPLSKQNYKKYLKNLIYAHISNKLRDAEPIMILFHDRKVG